MSSLSPWIVAADADGLLAFLADVLGAEESGRVAGPGGTVGHAETVVGGVTVVVMDAREGWAAQPALLRVTVPDLDSVRDRALDAGAALVTDRTSVPYGDDVVRFTDPWDNLWWVHQHVEDVAFEELLLRMDDPATQQKMAAFEASLDAEMRRRSAH